MREKQIEQTLVRKVKEVGGIAPKFVSPGLGGMPDRLLLFPGGRMAFVEVKAPGKAATVTGYQRHRLLTKLGFKVYVLDSLAGIDEIVGGDAG